MHQFPRFIHYIYWDFRSENRPIPVAWEQNVWSTYWLSKSDNWGFRIWDKPSTDSIMRQAIHLYCTRSDKQKMGEREEQMLAEYKKLSGVVQSDLARVAIIYFHGGIYADISDVIFNHSLEHILRDVPEDISDCHFHVERYSPNLSFGNASFGAKKENPIVLEWLLNLLSKLDHTVKKSPIVMQTQEDVFDFAGPIALTQYLTDKLLLNSSDHIVDKIGKDAVAHFNNVSIFRPEALIGIEVPRSKSKHGVHALEGSWKDDIPSEMDLRGRKTCTRTIDPCP